MGAAFGGIKTCYWSVSEMSESLELGDSQEEVPRVDHHVATGKGDERVNTVFSTEGIE